MVLHKVTFTPQLVDFLLPHNARLTNIEHEPGGHNIIPFGCRLGACGACVISVVSGEENLGDKGQAESQFLKKLGYPESEFRLACQCRLMGEAVIHVIPKKPHHRQ